MSPLGPAWNEEGQSESPAVELLERLGYVYAGPDTLEAERSGLRDVVLVGRLQAARLLQANEALYTAHGIALAQAFGVPSGLDHRTAAHPMPRRGSHWAAPKVVTT